ncbi:hypothetical protein [Dyella sp. C9]|uniref:hypothetical protein n=1 Tax=Dyella sp. C9 TaxID=2202154 RepID=UPI000DEFF84B|nr:hypothetical protein [Dyella sp. C9]
MDGRPSMAGRGQVEDIGRMEQVSSVRDAHPAFRVKMAAMPAASSSVRVLLQETESGTHDIFTCARGQGAAPQH